MSTQTTPAARPGARVHVQKFGTFLSNMIMPNIGALIAWGLITALFIAVGWTPNADVATMVGPTIHYLLPILIAYTGGRMVYGDRARRASSGRSSVIGVIVASWQPDLRRRRGRVADVPRRDDHGPAGGVRHEAASTPCGSDKIAPGFEMLVNNFSAGILARSDGASSASRIAPIVTWSSTCSATGWTSWSTTTCCR